MRTIFDMQLEIERRYKDGDDWVYDKGKKAEISLIKDLYTTCRNLRNEILEQREWVGFTKDEIDNMDLPDWSTREEFVWIIEAKLKEKQTNESLHR